MNNPNYSDYIVYVDESGDHGLQSIDSQYPIFSLACCIFKKSDYIDTIAPTLNRIKDRYWGHCDIVLHEHDMRKNMTGDWAILADKETRTAFMEDITTFIQNSPFHVITSVIQKQKLASRYKMLKNPYELAMLFCMERLHAWLLKNGQADRQVQIHFEARGKNENDELEMEFRRICDNTPTSVTSATDFREITYPIRFIDKKANSTGLQISDLVARPIGLKVLRPNQKNRAFDAIHGKIVQRLKIWPR